MAIDPVCGMKVDEKSALKINWQGKDYFFCSDRCRQKFINSNQISEAKSCPSCSVRPGEPWWQNRLLIILMAYLALFLLGRFLPLFSPWLLALIGYLRTIALPITIGLLLGGVIDWLVPSEYISKLLASNKKRTIIFSVIAGFLMSACSHGILALAIQLYKKGASPPAVVAFLLASPWANLPLTILMFGFFGWKTFLIVTGAIIIALNSGYIFMYLEKRKMIEHNPNTVAVAEEFSVVKDIQARLKQVRFSRARIVTALAGISGGAVSLANMVIWWVMLGMLLASLAAAYIPAGFMHHYMGPSFLGLLVTLFLATIIEICSEGSAPLAFELYRQTGAIGNSFTFLMAGVVTDYTEIGLIWANIGRRTASWLPLITVPQVIILSLIFNRLF